MREAGALTVAQDEATSAVFGMNAEAIRRGAARQVLPLDRIAEAALEKAELQVGNPMVEIGSLDRWQGALNHKLSGNGPAACSSRPPSFTKSSVRVP